MHCDGCKQELAGEAGHRQGDALLCEDCFIDKVTVLKTCDPWAVYTASRTATKDPGLTEAQRGMIDFLRRHGPATLGELVAALGLDEEEVRSNFTVLRHIKLAGAMKRGDEICYTLWRAGEDNGPAKG